MNFKFPSNPHSSLSACARLHVLCPCESVIARESTVWMPHNFLPRSVFVGPRDEILFAFGIWIWWLYINMCIQFMSVIKN